jgi:hypothetical protein
VIRAADDQRHGAHQSDDLKIIAGGLVISHLEGCENPDSPNMKAGHGTESGPDGKWTELIVLALPSCSI